VKTFKLEGGGWDRGWLTPGGNLFECVKFSRVYGPWDDAVIKTLEVCFRGLQYVATYQFIIYIYMRAYIIFIYHDYIYIYKC